MPLTTEESTGQDATTRATGVEHIVGHVSTASALAMPSALAVVDSPDALLAPIRLRELTAYEVAIEFPGSLADIVQARKQAGPSWPFLDEALNERVWHVHRSDNWPWRESEAGRQYTRVVGILNFKTHVGMVDLSITHGRTVRAEVAPIKLSFENDFRELLFALADVSTALILHVEGVSTTALALTDPTVETFRTQTLHLRRLMASDRLPAAISRILSAPHEQLHSEHELPPLALAYTPDLSAISRHLPDCGFRRGGSLASVFHGWTPERLPARHKYITLDTPENRFIKYALQLILQWLRQLTEVLPVRYEVTGQAVARWTLEVQNWLQSDMFRDVGNMTFLPLSSMVLQRRAGYREFLQAYLSFGLGLSLQSGNADMTELAQGNLRPIHRLYEYWCFLKMAEIMERVCGQEGVVARTLLRIQENGWELRLATDSSSRITFSCPQPPVLVEMWYNRDFTLDEFALDDDWNGAYTGLFHPDISLRVSPSSGPVHWIHFDAKYRLDRDKWLALFDRPREAVKNDERAGVFERGDLYTMHAYRDAVLGSRGSYVLYPGPIAADKPFFVRNPVKSYRNEHTIPSVGAFPLVPIGLGASAAQERDLEDFLRYLLTEIAAATGYQEEAGLISFSASIDGDGMPKGE